VHGAFPGGRGLREREPVSSSGVRLLPSFATPGPDAKNLLATRLLVSLPTGRVVSFFHRSRSWQGAASERARVIAPVPAHSGRRNRSDAMSDYVYDELNREARIGGMGEAKPNMASR
jgi:hypothetical protein